MNNNNNISIAWLKYPDNIHSTYGIQILSNNPVLIYQFQNSLINYCNRSNCKYFIQGKDLSGKINWLYFEFFGENNQNKILTVIEEFTKYWNEELYNNEVMAENPSSKLLYKLHLI